jgi:hypothetical protein
MNRQESLLGARRSKAQAAVARLVKARYGSVGETNSYVSPPGSAQIHHCSVTPAKDATSKSLYPFPHARILESIEGETISQRNALIYVPASTGQTVGYDPAHFSPWNESGKSCI